METAAKRKRIIELHVNAHRMKYLLMAGKWLRDKQNRQIVTGAEDAVQCALVDALRDEAIRYNPARPVGPWFSQVLLNRCRMIRRSVGRRNMEVRESEHEQNREDAEQKTFLEYAMDGIAGGDPFDELSAPYRTVGCSDGGVIDVDIADILRGISEREYAIFHAVFVDEEPRQQICKQFGLRPIDINNIRDHVRSVAEINLAHARGA